MQFRLLATLNGKLLCTFSNVSGLKVKAKYNVDLLSQVKEEYIACRNIATLGTHTSKRTMLRLRESIEKRHGSASTTILLLLALLKCFKI